MESSVSSKDSKSSLIWSHFMQIGSDSTNITDLYINKLDAGLAILSIAKGDPLKLTSPAQHALRG